MNAVQKDVCNAAQIMCVGHAMLLGQTCELLSSGDVSNLL